MKAIVENGKVMNIVPKNWDSGLPEEYEQDIKNFDFTPEKDEFKDLCLIGKAPKYYLEGTTLKKYTQAEIESTPEYKEKVINDLVAKEKEKAALKEVKKSKPELAELIDQKFINDITDIEELKLIKIQLLKENANNKIIKELGYNYYNQINKLRDAIKKSLPSIVLDQMFDEIDQIRSKVESVEAEINSKRKKETIVSVDITNCLEV